MCTQWKRRKRDFNAVKEFTDIETDSLIVSAAMTHFGMNKIDGKILGIKEKFEISFKIKFKKSQRSTEKLIVYIDCKRFQ